MDSYLEDQADLDDRMEAMRMQELQDLMARQSQALQMELPRPLSVNRSILRGEIHAEQRYRELYEAEELLKQEMLQMVAHDLVNFPPDSMTKQQKVSCVSIRCHRNNGLFCSLFCPSLRLDSRRTLWRTLTPMSC